MECVFPAYADQIYLRNYRVARVRKSDIPPFICSRKWSMGGNAFSTAERLSKSHYDMLSMGLQEIFNREQIQARIPLSYRSKDSFGDIDVIVPNREEADKILKQMDPVLGIVRNPQGYNVLISYLGQNVQVDLNIVGDGNMDFAFWYFSYNDLGNLIGRIAHRQGLKFGYDGLWYPHRINTTAVGEYPLTNDIKEALWYLGFDVQKYFDGFEDLEDMFRWVVDCVNFEGAAYPLEHRNHKARTRDSKRKNYNAFLEWLSNGGFDLTWVESDKGAWLKKHFMHWPELKKQYDATEADFHRRLAWKALFGGERAMALTGLTGKELGRFVDHLRGLFPVSQYYQESPENAETLVLKAFNEFTKEN